MKHRFVTEAILLTAYGQMLMPSKPVEYIIPYSSIMELYDFKESDEPIMNFPEDEIHVRKILNDLIAFLEQPLNSKKLEKASLSPWRKSPPILVNERVTCTVVNSWDNAAYGEAFDPIETELLLCAANEKAPILTDQPTFIERIVEGEIAVSVYDIEDFEWALEQESHKL